MDETTFQMFKGELEKQCRFASLGIEDLEQGLTSNNAFRIWCSIHVFLVAAGNISKIFWPPDEKHYSRRGVELRRRLSVDDDSPLKKRTPRNYLEHFDEYLEEWVVSTKSHQYVDLSYGSLAKIKEREPNVELKDFLRYFDYENFNLVFSGDLYDLKPIIESINKLWGKVKEVS